MTAWSPPGPVAAAFYETDAPLAVMMGPVGSGKTTVGLQRGVVRALYQRPGPDGRRRAKFVVVRRLYKDLEKTTMASWNRWYPRTVGTWRGAAGDPATHDITFHHPDGGLVDLRTEFIALGDLRIEEALRGLEATFGFVDECDGLAENALPFLLQRCGRFPPRAELGWSGVWGTCNAPEFDNHIVRDFIDEPKPGHIFFRQPGGLTPLAENQENLPPGYYPRLAETLPPYDKRRFVDNEPGLSRASDPVYPEFNQDLHVAREALPVLPFADLVVGLDAGGTPAAGIWQRAPNGQWRKLGELTTHEREGGSPTGPNRFGEALALVLRELERTLPPGKPMPRVRGIADPSAAYGADTRNGESTWIETVARVAGIPIYPCATNDPTPREEAYRLPMTRMIEGRTPGLLISARCTQTRRALARDYLYPRIRGAHARRAERPLKNWASHLVEADQYALLDGSALHEVTARQASIAALRGQVVADTRFNPYRN